MNKRTARRKAAFNAARSKAIHVHNRAPIRKRTEHAPPPTLPALSGFGTSPLSGTSSETDMERSELIDEEPIASSVRHETENSRNWNQRAHCTPRPVEEESFVPTARPYQRREHV